MQARAADDLRRLATEKLKDARLDFTEVRAFVTPRRLTLVVDGLPDRQPDVTEEKKGPKVGAPDRAVAGFVKANGLSDISEAEVRETPKGSFYFAVRRVEGRRTSALLADIVNATVNRSTWPKSMRWADGNFRWVRPLHNLLALFGGTELPGACQGLPFRMATTGHRFLAPGEFTVEDFSDYRDKLRAAKVILDREERKRIIADRAARLAAAEGLTLKEDPGLLDEVAGLVEWPVVLMGTVDKAYMDLPPEVLTGSMRGHQKYFSTLDGAGRLANRFVLVANMETADGGAAIVAGNERVLRARLADARFFWDRDRKRSLASRAPDLGQMVFHAKLGSLDDKADRMQALAAALCRYVPGADVDRVRSAARLAKADLTTGMVGEFPELQGVMGRYYALADGEPAEVAQAVAEHYTPRGPSDRCPGAPVSVVVALADKIDTLVGFWAIGETPTGSKDPYALRRAALGVIRLIVENRLRVPLTGVIETARGLYRGLEDGSVAGPLLDFLSDRLKVALRDKGVRHDLVAAVFALGGEDDLLRLLARVEALRGFLESDDGEHLLVAFRRAANIVRIEEKRDGARFNGAADPAQFAQGEETALADALDGAAETVERGSAFPFRRGGYSRQNHHLPSFTSWNRRRRRHLSARGR